MPPHDAQRIASLLLTVALGVLIVPVGARMATQFDHYPPLWTILLGAACLAALVLTAQRRVEAAARLLVGAGIIGLFSLPHVGTDQPDTPWLSSLYPTMAAATALVSRQLYVGVSALLLLSTGLVYAESEDTWGDAAQARLAGDLLFGISIAAIGLAFRLAVLESQRRLEDARSLAVTRFAAARASAATVQAAGIWDAYVHDEVIAALSQIAVHGLDDESRRTAAAAVDRARFLATGEVLVLALDEGLLDATLQTLPDTDTEFTRAEDAIPVPPLVCLALIEATTEALRNVRLHAYPGPPQTWPSPPARLVLRHGPERVSIEVSDTGLGFDRRQVEPARLGLAVSVEDRISTVGGSASIDSTYGRGTLVSLAWPGHLARGAS